MIKYLHKQEVPKTRIARELGLNRRTIDRAINDDEKNGINHESHSRCKLRPSSPIFPAENSPAFSAYFCLRICRFHFLRNNAFFQVLFLASQAIAIAA